MDTKKGKRSTSHRYNQLPLLRSRPGGFKGSWPCRTYPTAKVLLFSKPTKFRATFCIFGCNKTQKNQPHREMVRLADLFRDDDYLLKITLGIIEPWCVRSR